MKSIWMLTLALSIYGFTLKAQKMENQVKETVQQLFIATDARDWKKVEAIFDQEVMLDYTSMAGGEPARLTPQQITTAWQTILPGFDYTHHQLGNFMMNEVSKDHYQVFCYGTATHYLPNEKGNIWTVVGSYDFDVVKHHKDWKISKMTFHFKYQDGNLQLPALANDQVSNKSNSTTQLINNMEKVTFKSEGLKLVGNLYLPANYEKGSTYPAVIVAGSWTTVKEQMAGLYAQKFAEKGFIALAFDFRNFGESEGEPRFYESPKAKIQDIHNAVEFLKSRSEVAEQKIAAFGVCAGAGYILDATAQNKDIHVVATAASWIHDAEAVKLFYGGKEGVNAKITAAQEAKKNYALTGKADYIPSISTTDEAAAMFGEYDYYLNPKRGAISEWSADKFAVMSWEDWLTYSPMPSAQRLTKPTLMIHSDGAVLPDYTKQYFNTIISTDKKLHWIDSGAQSPFEQFDFYDQDDKVNLSVELASDWFKKKL